MRLFVYNTALIFVPTLKQKCLTVFPKAKARHYSQAFTVFYAEAWVLITSIVCRFLCHSDRSVKTFYLMINPKSI